MKASKNKERDERDRKIFLSLVEDILDMRFSKDEEIKKRILERIAKNQSKQIVRAIDLVKMFGSGYANTLMVIKQDGMLDIKNIYFMDADRKRAYEIKNLRQFKI